MPDAYKPSDAEVNAAAFSNVLNSAAGTTGKPTPVPPVNVLALAGNGAATVRFLTNTLALSGFRITASPGGAFVDVAAPTSYVQDIAFPGLNNGTAYTFTVQAIDARGVGAASLPSNSVTPTSLPSSILPLTRGLEFWWSARQMSGFNNGDTIAQLADMSGNGYHFASAAGGAFVSNWSGGKPAVSLNGSTQRYDSRTSGLLPGMRGPFEALFVVYSVAGNPNGLGASGGRILSADNGANSATILASSGGFGMGAGTADPTKLASAYYATNLGSGSGAEIAATAVTALNTPIIACATRPGRFRANGADIGGGIAAAIYIGQDCVWSIGAPYNGLNNKYLSGKVAEAAIFSTLPSPAEIAAMETYLAGAY